MKAPGGPGAGLLVFFATALLAVAFFAWGLRTPELETAWRIQGRLKLGRPTRLSPSERDSFVAALRHHPGLVDSMLDEQPIGLISANRDGLVESGYACLVERAPGTGRALEIAASDAKGERALDVELVVGKHTLRGQASAGAPLVLELPSEGPFPRLIEVKSEGKQHAIRIHTRERP